MKLNFMRGALALALALTLAACGGKAEFTVGGTITGLQYDKLALSDGKTTINPKAKDTTFAFPSGISYGDAYAVTATGQPDHQNCTVYNGADTAGRLAGINISVVCYLQSHTIGGTITGLTAEGLQLTNGTTGGVLAIGAAAATFTMPVEVPYGSTYGVTILQQPIDQWCTLQNGTGTMGDANLANMILTCIPVVK
jgi:hypothetical protein